MKRTKARTRVKREADPVRCAYCKATGKDPNAFLYFRPCPVCKGKGWVRPELPRRGYEERVMEAYDRRYAEHAGPPGALASFYAEVKAVAHDADKDLADLMRIVNGNAPAIVVATQRWSDVDRELREAMERGDYPATLRRLKELTRCA